MLRRDGWEAELRLGVLTPHADVGPESEIGAMAPAGVGVHASRAAFGAMGAGGAMDPTIPLAPVRAFAEPPDVDEAVELLGAAPVAAIGFAFTSSGFVIGADGERRMLERLSTRSGGTPVVGTCTAALGALDELGARRLALVCPPWFDDELVELGARFFAAAGLEVVMGAAAGLPSDQAAIEPGALEAWLTEAVPTEADAVFIGGNGFRAVGVIEAVEDAIDRPVLSANQVLLWQMLRTAGAGVRPEGYGRLFEPPAAAGGASASS